MPPTQTANEQAILRAANAIGAVVGTMRTQIESLNARIAVLMEQAQGNPVPPGEVENVTDEVQQLNQAVGQLEEFVASLNASASGTPSGPTEPAGDTGEPSSTGGPIVHGENTPIPLAGESGTTDGGVPLVAQPQPGTNPTTSGTSEGGPSTEVGSASNETTASAPATAPAPVVEETDDDDDDEGMN